MNKKAKYIFKKTNMFRKLLRLSRFVFPIFMCKNKEKRTGLLNASDYFAFLEVRMLLLHLRPLLFNFQQFMEVYTKS